jgi:UDP-N-acetylglucosamine 2-epimerase (non-hydrolysing)
MGTNILAGTKKELILKAYKNCIERKKEKLSMPPKWDGKAAQRIWKVLCSCLS